GGGVGGAGLLGSSSGVLAGIGRGVLGNVLTQGTSLALGLQRRFDFVGLAVAGVAGGVGDVVSDGKTGTWRQIKAGAASAIAAAATRSIATGTSFGDNVLAVLPDVIGSTIGRVVGNMVATRAAAKTPSQAGATVADPRLDIDVAALLTDDLVTGGAAASSATVTAAASSVASAKKPAGRGTITVEEVPVFQGGPHAGQAVTAATQYVRHQEPYVLTDSNGRPVLDPQGHKMFGLYAGRPNSDAVWVNYGSEEDYLALQRWQAVNSLMHGARLVASDIGGGIYDVGAGVVGATVAVSDIASGGDRATARIAGITQGIGRAIDDPMSVVRGALSPLEQMFMDGSIRGLTSHTLSSAIGGTGDWRADASALRGSGVCCKRGSELR
ncbi:hypothetical protein, partial [Sphingomonas sp. VNH70]|uniref:hypothetical protein n=1 Tax=Sphingomonas silueang TaxID=3156617 RepID=UPI0032B4E56F